MYVCTIRTGNASATSSTQPGASTFSAVWPGVIFPAQTLRNTKEETTQVLELHIAEWFTLLQCCIGTCIINST